MKKRKPTILSFSLAILIVVAYSAVDAFGANGNCPEAITGYWKLDETASGLYADDIGANDGTCSGAECPAWVSGAIGNGQMFDGVSDSINVAADASFNWSASQSFTIEMWMRRNTPTSGVLEVFVGRTDAGLNWYIGINGSGNAQASLKAADGSGPGLLTVSKTLASSSSDPTWHHVALVRDASLSKTTLYVDGQSSSQTFTYATGFGSDSAPLTIGALSGGNRFRGGLDEVAIYGRALNANEIKSHYYVARGYCNLFNSPVRIMPMGDSITKGTWTIGLPADSNMVGYRLDLSDLLGDNLYRADFIGSQHNGWAFPDFDDEHAGFGGITDDQLFTLLNTGVDPRTAEDLTGGGPYLDAFPTDLILLHIGTNDEDTDTTAVSNILNEIDSFSKNTTVLLARIINQVINNPIVTTYNNNIADMVADRIALGDKIIMVDMESGAGLTYIQDTVSPYINGDMYENLHPNPSGYNKMAGQWFTTLETVLPQSEIPMITSTAPTEAVKGQLYTYTVTANGPPSPTYSLSNKPTGMTIDPISGLIEWTPAAVGDHAVSLQALNWAGQDTQSFTISVNALPQAIGDAYSDILEGGTLTVSAAQGVLSNDTDENDTLSVVLKSDVSYGTLNLSADGSFTYIHNGSENFNDSFTYAATDGKAESAPVTVTLTITPVDDPIDPPITPSGGGGGGGCFITTLF